MISRSRSIVEMMAIELTPTQEKLVMKMGKASFKISITSSMMVSPLSGAPDGAFVAALSPASTSVSFLEMRGSLSVAAFDILVLVAVGLS